MKKIFTTLALIVCMQFAFAQPGGNFDAKKAAVSAAEKDSQDAKKATKVATWMKLAQAYVDAYDAPAGNARIGAGRQELKLVMGNAKPSSTENVVVAGEQLTKESYGAYNFYFNASDVLAIVEITKPVIDGALDKAVAAYKKAVEVDAKNTKTKDIANALQAIVQKYIEEASNEYYLGHYDKASKLFEAAAETSAMPPYSQLDASSFYNAGFVAFQGGNLDRAKDMFLKSIENDYFGEGGEVYAKLASVYENSDPALSKKYLEEGFSKFPESQGILIGLINYYMKNNEDTGKLFELIDKAKANEPGNASLYYVEGNIHSQLKDFDAAAAAYEKCAEINPNYEYGYVGEGIMFYNRAIELQEQAQNELDDAKYTALLSQFETALKACIAPFEKAFNITKDDVVKTSVAEYLKNACYRFRDEDASYQAAYDKYAAVVAAN